jgi:hypothetical protein
MGRQVPSYGDQQYLVELEPKLVGLENLRSTAILQLEVCLENRTDQNSILK